MNPALSVDSSIRARRLLVPFAWIAVFLTFVVIVASAFIRHTQAGLDCADWPACYARVNVEPMEKADAESPSAGVRVARSLHRVAASSALLVILGVLLLARAAETGTVDDRRAARSGRLRPWGGPAGAGDDGRAARSGLRPWDGPAGARNEGRAARSGLRPWGGPAGSWDDRRSRSTRTLAIAAIVLAVGLAVLGVVTRGAQLPAVPLGNLVGGYLMLAVLAALVGSVTGAAIGASRQTVRRVRWLAWMLLGLVFVQVALGGLIGTQFALRSCITLDHCAGAASDAFAPGAALDPFRHPDIVSGHVVPPKGAAGLHVMHRWLAIAITLGVLTLAFALRSTQRRAAALLTALALAALLLGIAAILRMPALAATVLHNAAAASLVATLAFILARRARSIDT